MKLNIGSGKTRFPGFEPWDIKDGKPAYPLALPDNSVEEIYASHVLEHFSFRETVAVLRDWCRALQPGGRLRVAVPDFDYILKSYASKEPKDAPIEMWLMGAQTDEHDQHRAIFTQAKLVQCLQAAGFERFGNWAPSPDMLDCSALPVSLNVEAFKVDPSNRSNQSIESTPSKVQPRGTRLDPKRHAQLLDLAKGVVAVWTTPRYALSITVDCAYRSLPPLGISLLRSAGVYWDQCLERIIDQAIDGGASAILTLDYDSVWEPADLHRLLELYHAHPDVAVICPLQWARSIDKPLWQRLDAQGRQSWPGADELRANALVPVTTAHFGLSIFRPALLRDLPRPWLHHVPGPGGSWTTGKVDADIGFWLKLRDAGRKVCIAPEVVIGHIEEVATWPAQDLSAVHQYLFDYYDKQRPPAAFVAQPQGPTK
jgi:predicted SAM-dependent methyltransferase